MRSHTSIHPATVIVALTSGYAIGGVLGAVAAIPVFAAARVVLLHVIAPTVRSANRRHAQERHAARG
jgi:predicted PurR-regulated permease PerM